MNYRNKIKLLFRFPIYFGVLLFDKIYSQNILISKNKYYEIMTKIHLKLLSIKCIKFRYGSGIIFNGKPIFKIDMKAKVFLSNNIIINSSTKSNLAGLYKKTTIVVESGAKLTMKENCGVSGISIYCRKSITIGENTLIGVNCIIWDTDFHQIRSQDRLKNNHNAILCKEILIGDNVFIGGNSIILKGTRIGDGSVISSGSVVSGRIPKNQVWGGNPARFLYSITENDIRMNK